MIPVLPAMYEQASLALNQFYKEGAEPPIVVITLCSYTAWQAFHAQATKENIHHLVHVQGNTMPAGVIQYAGNFYVLFQHPNEDPQKHATAARAFPRAVAARIMAQLTGGWTPPA